MDINENRAVACPVWVGLHQFAPYPVCCEEECFIPMSDDCCVLAKRGHYVRGVDPDRLYHLADGMLPFHSFIVPDDTCDFFCGAIKNHGNTINPEM